MDRCSPIFEEFDHRALGWLQWSIVTQFWPGWTPGVIFVSRTLENNDQSASRVYANLAT